MKKCTKCLQLKNEESFSIRRALKSGLRSQCKSCDKIYTSSYTPDVQKKKTSNRLYALKNKEKISAYKKEWFRREHVKRQRAIRISERMKRDLTFFLVQRLRQRFAIALERGYKGGSAVKNLGCSIEDFKLYLESKFLPGMTWDNYGRTSWHIDHIRPLSSFNLANAEDVAAACHYTNLQPLWAVDNILKSDTWQKN